MKKGVLYICHGKRYTDEACLSAKSLKKFCPDIHITMFADVDTQSKYIDDVKIINPQTIRSKVYTIYDSPYDQTLFLDTDIIFNYRVDDVFDLFDKYDIALAHDLARKREKFSKVMPEYGIIPYAFSELNTGVIAFRKCTAVKDLFEKWQYYHSKYYKICPYDQPSFRISLWESDVNVYVLPTEYNVRSKQNRQKQINFHHEFGEEHMETRIFHMHHGKSNYQEALQFCKDNHLPY